MAFSIMLLSSKCSRLAVPGPPLPACTCPDANLQWCDIAEGKQGQGMKGFRDSRCRYLSNLFTHGCVLALIVKTNTGYACLASAFASDSHLHQTASLCMLPYFLCWDNIFGKAAAYSSSFHVCTAVKCDSWQYRPSRTWLAFTSSLAEVMNTRNGI